MKPHPKPAADLAALLLGEADTHIVERLAEAAAGDAELARTISSELNFTGLLREALRSSTMEAGAAFQHSQNQHAAGLAGMMNAVEEGLADAYACDQVAKHLIEHPSQIPALRSRLAEAEWFLEALVPGKGEDAFLEALETRMWAETTTDRFVDQFALRLVEVDRVSSRKEVEESVVAFPGSWFQPVWRGVAAAAALALGAFWVSGQLSSHLSRQAELGKVVKASPDASWVSDLVPSANGGIIPGRYELEQGIVSLKFDSGNEITVEGPALFDVAADATTFVHRGVALARAADDSDGSAVNSKGLNISTAVPLLGIDARAEFSTEAVVFEGVGGICLSEGGACREMFPYESVKADLSRQRFVDVPFNPQPFAKAWEHLAGVETNMGSVRIELPGSEFAPTRSDRAAVQVYVEREHFRPESNLDVDAIQVGEFSSTRANPGQMLQASGDLRSYLLELWPNAEATTDGEEVEASITFDHPVVGIIFSSDRLASSDDYVGRSRDRKTAILDDRGLSENEDDDTILLSSDRRTLNLRLRGGVAELDQIRVLVALN
jgi:hypothetical protein